MKRKKDLEVKLNHIEQEVKYDPPKILPFSAACKYLNVSASHLYKLTSSNKIPFYKPNGKLIYFMQKDLDMFLLRKKIKSSEELDIEAINFMTTKSAK